MNYLQRRDKTNYKYYADYTKHEYIFPLRTADFVRVRAQSPVALSGPSLQVASWEKLLPLNDSGSFTHIKSSLGILAIKTPSHVVAELLQPARAEQNRLKS